MRGVSDETTRLSSPPSNHSHHRSNLFCIYVNCNEIVCLGSLLLKFTDIVGISSGRNVFYLTALREICPTTNHVPKRRWGEASNSKPCPRDARRGLLSWYTHKLSLSICISLFVNKWKLFFRVEAETLRRLSAKYCPLEPPPRSTIAAAFSPDGTTLASTQYVVTMFCFLIPIHSSLCNSTFLSLFIPAVVTIQ